ncbi:MAG: hypothetical protein GY913_13375 [Proteobacteria bacterium]|nr:hypothetical protein [Pseudomonadota bacterium]MCP4917898.1 hypothetical protein [Pseudomonadota bacterium]
MSVLSGDLSEVLLPRDLELLRDAATDGSDNGADLRPMYEALAATDPVALVDLVMGPRAVRGDAAIDAALAVVTTLESASSPAALFRRLADLAPQRATDVLAVAATRHPGAGWILPLAEKVETPVGALQLAAAVDHPAFSSVCAAHAARGHCGALIGVAALGRPEPTAHLAAAGHEAEAVDAAAAALLQSPDCRIVPWLAAACGPESEGLFRRILTRLTTREAVEAMQEDLAPFPHTAQLFRLVRAGLRS